MKNKIAKGRDELRTELIKYLNDKILLTLVKIYNTIHNSKVMTEDFSWQKNNHDYNQKNGVLKYQDYKIIN